MKTIKNCRRRGEYPVAGGVQIARIHARDGGRCVYCGSFASSVDHIIPVAAGGKTLDDNLVSACARCNQAGWKWHFPSLEHRRRYILMYRFGKKVHAKDFRQQHAIPIRKWY